MKLVCDKEALEYENDIPMKLDCDIKLSEYISAKVKYNYDFGDSWQHYIDVVKVLPDFDHNYPVCIGGEGSTPPEDVGGEQGYEEFLEVIANQNHPEYEGTVNGGKDKTIRNLTLRRSIGCLKSSDHDLRHGDIGSPCPHLETGEPSLRLHFRCGKKKEVIIISLGDTGSSCIYPIFTN